MNTRQTITLLSISLIGASVLYVPDMKALTAAKQTLSSRTPTPSGVDKTLTSKTSKQIIETQPTRASLRARKQAFSLGDKVSYKGLILMKLDGSNPLSTDNIQLINEQWNRSSNDFISHELGLGESALQDYLEAKRSSFQEYDSLFEPLENEVNKKFGSQLQIMLGEDLGKLHDASWETYQNKLRTILGSAGFARFERFRDDYADWVYQKFEVGANDLR